MWLFLWPKVNFGDQLFSYVCASDEGNIQHSTYSQTNSFSQGIFRNVRERLICSPAFNSFRHLGGRARSTCLNSKFRESIIFLSSRSRRSSLWSCRRTRKICVPVASSALHNVRNLEVEKASILRCGYWLTAQKTDTRCQPYQPPSHSFIPERKLKCNLYNFHKKRKKWQSSL